MSIARIHENTGSWMPTEVNTAAIGTTLAGASNVTIQFLSSSANPLSGSLKSFPIHCCGAASIAGTVMAVYSMIRLCEKIISKETALHEAVTVTTLGCLFTAIAQTICEEFWMLAPSFENGHQLAFCIGTNFVWQASGITALASILFTAYAAYKTGKIILATIHS